jgi:hypothetical protein
MRQNVKFVRGDDEIGGAAETMRNPEIGFLPVCNPENKKIVGRPLAETLPFGTDFLPQVFPVSTSWTEWSD